MFVYYLLSSVVKAFGRKYLRLVVTFAWATETKNL